MRMSEEQYDEMIDRLHDEHVDKMLEEMRERKSKGDKEDNE